MTKGILNITLHPWQEGSTETLQTVTSQSFYSSMNSFLLRHNFQVKAMSSLGQRMESFSKDWPECFKSVNLVKSVSLMKSIVCESGYSWGPPTISHCCGTFLPWFTEFSEVYLRTTIERAKSVIHWKLGRTSIQCQKLSKNVSWLLENWLCCFMYCCDLCE